MMTPLAEGKSMSKIDDWMQESYVVPRYERCGRQAPDSRVRTLAPGAVRAQSALIDGLHVHPLTLIVQVLISVQVALFRCWRAIRRTGRALWARLSSALDDKPHYDLQTHHPDRVDRYWQRRRARKHASH